MRLQDEMTRAKQKAQDRARVRALEVGSVLPLAPAAIEDCPDVLKQVLGLCGADAGSQPGAGERRVLGVQPLECFIRRNLAPRCSAEAARFTQPLRPSPRAAA